MQRLHHELYATVLWTEFRFYSVDNGKRLKKCAMRKISCYNLKSCVCVVNILETESLEVRAFEKFSYEPRQTLASSLKVKSESCSVVSGSLRPHGLYSPWNSPGQNTGVGSLSFSRGPSQPRDWTQFSRIAGRFFTRWATRKPRVVKLEGKIR